MDGRFACQIVGKSIVAKFEGEPTERVLEDCQAEILSLVHKTAIRAVLYDLRAVVPPPIQVLVHQQALEPKLQALKLRRAVVVPNMLIGYLARIAFTAGECRVFYDDYAAAIKSLSEEDGFSSRWGLAVREERRVRERRANSRIGSGRRLAGGPSS